MIVHCGQPGRQMGPAGGRAGGATASQAGRWAGGQAGGALVQPWRATAASGLVWAATLTMVRGIAFFATTTSAPLASVVSRSLS